MKKGIYHLYLIQDKIEYHVGYYKNIKIAQKKAKNYIPTEKYYLETYRSYQKQDLYVCIMGLYQYEFLYDQIYNQIIDNIKNSGYSAITLNKYIKIDFIPF